jgi:hypothetical protein
LFLLLLLFFWYHARELGRADAVADCQHGRRRVGLVHDGVTVDETEEDA